jgi:hypothetical protein
MTGHSVRRFGPLIFDAARRQSVMRDGRSACLNVCCISPTPVERHARAGGHPVPMPSLPGFPLSRE